jgi:alkaline phosphatase D
MMKRLLALLTVFLVGAGAAPAEKPSCYGLVAHWSFEQDYSSGVNNELYQGTVRGGQFVQIDRSPGAARVGTGALRLNSGTKSGNGVFVHVPTSLYGAAGVSVLSIAGWFKLQDVSDDGMDQRNMLWESVPGYSTSFGVQNVDGHRLSQFRFRTEDYKSLLETRGPMIEPGAWYHVVMVWNQTARHIRYYLQGNLVKELPLPEHVVMEPMRGLNIGNGKLGDGAADWDGWVDDLAVFDLELSPRQVKALASGSWEGTPVSAANVLSVVSDAGSLSFIAGLMPVPPVPASEQSSQGPLIGHVSDQDAVIWARVPQAGEYKAVATSSDGRQRVEAETSALEENDWCLQFRLAGLKPKTDYRVSFLLPEKAPCKISPISFRTAPEPHEPTKVVLGFGSCADFPDNYLWTRIAADCPDGMVLLGDTPYIDSTELRWQRWAYRRFSSAPRFLEAFQKIPMWATWDDHDFGKNAADGTLPGKENSIKAFREYRPNWTSGENGQGVYTRFRRGPVEVFVLDTRWFSGTEPSWADPSRPTLLGHRQWEWLKRGLLSSTAPFKILACGMVWDEKGIANEGDAWGAYMYERRAIEHWLGENKIAGVVLIGGDIHVSRLLRYDTRAVVGYDLYQFVISPLHDRLIPLANVPDPNLLASGVEPWVFLRVTVDGTQTPPTLLAECVNRDGKVFFKQEISAADLAGSGGAAKKVVD